MRDMGVFTFRNERLGCLHFSIVYNVFSPFMRTVADKITSCRDSVVFLLLNICHKGVHKSKGESDEY